MRRIPSHEVLTGDTCVGPSGRSYTVTTLTNGWATLTAADGTTRSLHVVEAVRLGGTFFAA